MNKDDPKKPHPAKAYFYNTVQEQHIQLIKQTLWIWLASATAVFLMSVLEDLLQKYFANPLLIASFGASVVLLFATPQSPMARPKNIIFGYTFSGLIGVVAFQFLGEYPLIASSVAVATAITVMQVTDTLHAPGGATALIAVTGGEHIHALGYWYVLMPCAAGALLLLLLSVFINKYAHRSTFKGKIFR